MPSILAENEQYLDLSGAPLVNGRIFIGVQNQDPVVNPQTIYSDRDLTVSIDNPQTLDAYGRSTNKIWVASEYSVRIDDSTGTQIYQNLDAGGERDSDNISFLQSGAGAVSRTTQSKLREWVSVTDFNVAGDGVTDDTAGIQAAIDSLTNGSQTRNPDSVGGTVYFPPGKYRTTSVVEVDTTDYGVRLIGAGMDASLIYGDHSGKVLDVYGTSGGPYTKDFEAYGLGFRSTATAQAVGSSLIRIRYLHYFNIHDCQFLSSTEHGIEVDDAFDGIIQTCRFEAESTNFAQKYSIRLTGTPNQITIFQCWLEDAHTAAIYVDIGAAVAIRDCLFQSLERDGILFDTCETLLIEGNYFEINGQSNTADAADIKDAGSNISSNVTIKSNFFNGDSNTATHRVMDLQDCRGFSIIHNNLNGGSAQIIRIASDCKSGHIAWNQASTQPTLDFTGEHRFTGNFLNTGNTFWNDYRDSDKIWRQTVSYANPITPDAKLGRWFEVTVTGDMLVNAVTNIQDEDEVFFAITQDGVGGHAVTWNANYKLSASLGSTASQRYTIRFIYDAGTGKFYEVSQSQGQTA